MVVEEDAPKPKKRARGSGPLSEHKLMALDQIEPTLEDEEEDEVSEDEEEEDKFDIDDSSPEAEVTTKPTEQTNGDHDEGQMAAVRSPLVPTLSKRRAKSRSLSRSRARVPYSGVDSPSRYAVPPPHASPRHVGFDIPSTDSSASSSPDSLVSYAAQQGTRDELHLPRHLSGKSRIPKDRDLDAETAKTPTPGSLVHRRVRGQSRSRSVDVPEHRAFAVWGHDESDSNASDSES